MENDEFIDYETVKELLEKEWFFGFTCHREEGGRKISYKFISIKWDRTTIEVLTLKLEPENVVSRKIVTGIKINGKEIENLDDFKDILYGITKRKKT